MIPVHCRVGHKPDEGTYGDCVRACIASILEMDAEQVPHFYHDGIMDGAEGTKRIRDWLRTLGLAPYVAGYPGQSSLQSVLDFHGENNPGVHYLLYGGAEGGGDHVVVCKDDKIVHDPAWYPIPFIGPPSAGHWLALVLARR